MKKYYRVGNQKIEDYQNIEGQELQSFFGKILDQTNNQYREYVLIDIEASDMKNIEFLLSTLPHKTSFFSSPKEVLRTLSQIEIVGVRKSIEENSFHSQTASFANVKGGMAYVKVSWTVPRQLAPNGNVSGELQKTNALWQQTLSSLKEKLRLEKRVSVPKALHTKIIHKI